MPKHDELDLLVHAGLATYADPVRESGLEERILARIAAETTPRPRRRWLPWAIALPVAAGLLVLLLLSTHRQPPPPLAHHRETPLALPPELANAGRNSSSVPFPTRRENVRGGRVPPHSRGTLDTSKVQPLPKLDVFPSPQPISPEEQALAAFAASATETERLSLIEAHEQADAPIRIAAIEIPPLNAPDNGDN